MTRLLVVDGSPTERSLVVAILRERAPEIAVVGEAADGAEALELARRKRPDVISVGLDLPDAGGVEATRAIMDDAPTPVVGLSSSTAGPSQARDAACALAAGAVAVVRKPRGPLLRGGDAEARLLVEAIRAAAGARVVRPTPLPPDRQDHASRGVARPGPPPEAIGIVASTGGPAALKLLLTSLPEDLPVPLLVVQHMAPGFVGGLVTWLQDGVRLRVKLAEAGEALRPATAYVAPDETHLCVAPGRCLDLRRGAPIDRFRPSGSVLFESLAEVFGARALGVVLTGMGRDGARGLRRLKRAGGLVVAQDEASSAVFGMPAAAIKAGVVDVVVGLEKLPAVLADVLRKPR